MLRLTTLLAALTVGRAANCSFPIPQPGKMCYGFTELAHNKMGAQIKTLPDCAAACCGLRSCTAYQFGVEPPSKHGSGCWIFSTPWAKGRTCGAAVGWSGRAGAAYAPPPPPPPPGAPKQIYLPDRGPRFTPLPFQPDAAAARDPVSGVVVGADSLSMLRNGKRWYPRGGEVHLARLPAVVWREQLLRMKAGGLDSVAVYVFWIHHEEARGVFTFSGRRDVRRFVTIAGEVGLKVLMRVGPWDHGECRNGGHPDWVLSAKGAASCGQLRTTDAKYLACVQGWYTALATELKGLYHSDGGPIVFCQVDNGAAPAHCSALPALRFPCSGLYGAAVSMSVCACPCY